MKNRLEEKLELANLLSKNPVWVDILKEAMEVEKKGRERYEGTNYSYLGFEWYEVHAHPHVLHAMVTRKLLDITHSSRSSTYYKVRDPELVKEAIKILERSREKIEKEKEVPRDLFNIIVGHDKVKWVLKASIVSKDPVHVLLVGPVATAKTLFLSELSRLPESRYILGSASSKAGIIDFLLEYRPKYLIIDEIEKSDGRDLSALLSLMQTGIVTRMKKGMRESEMMKTWVFAGANSISKLPQELKSRFLIINFKEYSITEFKRVAITLLKREGLEDSFGRYIIDKLIPYTRDVRDAIKVARIAKTKQEVDRIIPLVFK